MKQLLSVFLALVVMFQAVGAVSAAGTETTKKEECKTETGAYGQTSKVCKIVTKSVEPVHEPVEAGVGDINFWVLSLLLIAGTYGFYKLAKATQHLYWFE